MTDFSYQLYSSRNFPPLNDTLKMLADLGYRGVEGFGALFADPERMAQLREGLAETGLQVPSGHFGLDMVSDAPDRVIDTAVELGIKTVYVPHLAPAERPVDSEGWLAFGQRLASAGAPITAAGIGFGWHNHAFEFQPTPQGDLPLDLILQGGEGLLLEFDAAWAVVGGQDPLDWIHRYSGRLAALHVKDIAPTGAAEDEDGWADVGHGTMDWPALLASARAAGCDNYIMEHDNPNDDKRFARRSIEAMRAC